MNTQQFIADCIGVLMIMACPLAVAVGGQNDNAEEETAAGCPLVKDPVLLGHDDTECPREADLVFFPSHGQGGACEDCSGDDYDFLWVDVDRD